MNKDGRSRVIEVAKMNAAVKSSRCDGHDNDSLAQQANNMSLGILSTFSALITFGTFSNVKAGLP